MATSTNRDVKLTVEATTLGEESIRALATQVRQLGKEGGDAAPQFTELASELDRLADQAQAAQTFGALEASVAATGAAVENATIAFNAAKGALDQQSAATAALKVSQAEAAGALSQARIAAIDAREAYQVLNAEIKASGTATEADTQRLRDAAIARAESAAEVARQRLALQQLNDETSTATAAESKLAAAVRARSKELSTAQSAAGEQASALRNAATAAAALEVDTTDLAGAQQRLLSMQQELTRAVLAQQAALAAARADQDQAAQNALYAEYLEAVGEINAALAQEAAALEALNAQKAEQAESDRLAIIQNNALFEARREGAEALHAERVAIAETEAATALLTEEQARARAAADAFAASALKARESVEQAFSQVGVRSIAAIRAEIDATERSLVILEAEFERGAISSQDLARAVGAAEVRLQALRAEAARLPEAAGALEAMNASVTGLVARFGALGAAVATVGFAAKPVLDATNQLQQMQRVLTQVFGSLDAANQQITFLQQTANQSGVAVDKISQSFVTFAASAKAAGVDLGTIRDVFAATVNAAGNLGLSGEKVNEILDALGQMAGKGVVSMQELREQLGNSLPGALSLMAQGLGISVAQLTKMVESGQLLTTQVLGPLAQAMTTLGSHGKDVEGLQQSFARLSNAVTQLYQRFSDTTAYRVLNASLGALADNLGVVVSTATTLGELWAASKVVTYIGNLGRLNTSLALTKAATDGATASTAASTAAEVANTAAQIENTVAREANAAASVAQGAANVAGAAQWGNLAGSIGSAGKSFGVAAEGAGLLSRSFGLLGTAARGVVGLVGGLPGLLLIVATNARALGTAIGETIAAHTSWGKILRDNEAKMKAQDDALRASAATVRQSSASWVQLIAQYNDAIGPLEKAIAASEKHAKAVEEQGTAMKAIAALSGNQRSELNAAAVAAANTAAALQSVADQQMRQADLTKTLVADLQTQATVNGRLTSSEQQKLTALQATLAVQEASAEQAQGQADSAKTAAAAADLEAQKYGDLSASLDLLRSRYENATEKVTILSGLLRDGMISQAQYNDAVRDAAAAEGLLAKATADTVAAAQRKADAIDNDLKVTAASTNAAIAASKANAAFYTSIGDLASATREKITQDELEEAQLRRSIAAKQAIAQATQDAAQKELDNARATGTLTPALQDEIDKRIANAKAMAIEAGAEQSRIAEIDAEISKLNAQADAQARATNAVQSNTAAVQQNAAAQAAAARAANGGADPANTGAVDATGAFDVLAKLKAGALTSGDLGEVQAALAAAKQNQQADIEANKSGFITHEAFQQDQAILAQLQAALDKLNGTNGNSSIGSGNQKATPTSTSHTVTVNIGGSSTTVNAASANDATAVVALVKQLGLAASTTQGG